MGIYHQRLDCGCLVEYTTYDEIIDPYVIQPCCWHKLIKKVFSMTQHPFHRIPLLVALTVLVPVLTMIVFSPVLRIMALIAI